MKLGASMKGAALVMARRLPGLLLTLLVSSIFIFSAMYLAPGNPVSALTGGRQVSPAAEKALEAEYHLNDSFVSQYLHWLGGAVHGDFGTSYVARGQSVGSQIVDRLPTTLLLLAMASLAVFIFGVLLGSIAAIRGRRTESVITTVTAVGMGIPSFVAGSFLISFFAVRLGWFPVFGPGEGLPDQIYHLILPTIALALATLAYVAQVSRVAIGNELNRDHVDTAYARGMGGGWVIRKHVLRNAAIPITTVCGVTIAFLITGTAVVEQVFQLNGIGSLLIDSVISKDLPMVQGICFVAVIAIVLINLVVDGLYGVLDPRVRR